MMRILALSFVVTVVLAGDITEDAKQAVQEIATTKVYLFKRLNLLI